MKKRFLSMLLVVCLAVTMMPAAFAADEENGRPIPDELPIVYEEDAAALASDEMTADYPGSGTQNDPIVVEIHDKSDFQYLVTACQKYTGKYYKVKLMTDLKLDEMGGTAPAQWNGYLNYFMGTFDGNGKTISGIPEDCYLFYQIHNATIGNFTLDLEGQAGTLMYYTFRISKSTGIEWGIDRLYDIDVISDETVQLVGNGQANYAPFMFAAGPYFTMDGCKNYANISGDTYAAVFSGYYPLPAKDYPSDCYFEFIDCENHGNVTLRYAGLVFGNPTGLREDRHISFGEHNDGMKNFGEIRGIESAHFFSSDAGANDYFTGSGYFSETEDMLDPKDKDGNFIPDGNLMRLTCDEAGCPNSGKTGTLYFNHKLDEFAINVNDKGQFVVTPDPDAGDGVQYYVTAYHYVNLYDEAGKSQGTARVSYSEKVTDTNYATRLLADLYLRDGVTIPEEMKPMLGSDNLYYGTIDGVTGYWLDNDVPRNGSEPNQAFYLYIVDPNTPGGVRWDVFASAYDKDGNLIDTVPLNRAAA